MRKILALALLAASATAIGANDRSVVDLDDGGKLAIDQKSTMAHIDAADNRVQTKDHVVMENRGDEKIMMNNDAISKQIT